MENRYLYKAKRLDNGEWVEGYLVEQEHPDYHAYIIRSINIEMDEKYIDILQHEIYEVNPETICQCTGLTDKNGNKIWENDILSQKTTEKHWCQWSRKVIVKFGEYDWNEDCDGCKNIGFFLEQIEKNLQDMGSGLTEEYIRDKCYIYEVVGNIFDNPELLESEG